MIGRLVAAIRRWFGRRAARRLLAEGLPRGLAPSLLLPPPPEPLLEGPPGEYWTLPLGLRPPARLLRLPALPPPRRDVSAVRALRRSFLEPRIQLPRRLAFTEPLRSRIVELGVAQPRRFGLDEELRNAVEREPLRVVADAPSPARERRARPRAPLGRAPLWRTRLRNFRLDAQASFANEQIIALTREDRAFWWVRPEFRRRFIDLPWMARDKIAFLGPTFVEWFLMWWEQNAKDAPGGAEPQEYELPRELFWALDAVKEQMLIRRDVRKDENPPKLQEFGLEEIGVQIASHEPDHDLAAMVPETEWVEKLPYIPPPPLDQRVKDVYLQWRTLVDSLEER